MLACYKPGLLAPSILQGTLQAGCLPAFLEVSHLLKPSKGHLTALPTVLRRYIRLCSCMHGRHTSDRLALQQCPLTPSGRCPTC